MEKIKYFYKFTSNTTEAFAYFPDILREISKDYKIYLKKSSFSENEWIFSDTEEFNQELKLDLSKENEFFSEKRINFKFKIEDTDKIVSLIEFYEVWGFLHLSILYEKCFDFVEWENSFSKKLLIEKVSEDEVEEKHSSLNSINKKVVQIDRKLNEMIKFKKDVKRIFLSMRFDEHSKCLAFDLNKFLSLLNIEMVTGIGVEPRSISEKVQERLERKIDLFVILLTNSGNSDWMNQEIGYAKAKKLPILILKECNIGFNQGMLSDNEYIEFKEISEVYIGILETIKYLENKNEFFA